MRALGLHKKMRLGLDRTRCSQTVPMCLVIFLFLNIIFLNVVIYCFLSKAMMISQVAHDVWNDKRPMHKSLEDYPLFDRMLRAGKNGTFVKLKEEILERVFVVTYPTRYHSTEGHISWMGLDVSHSQESSFIYRRITQRPSWSFTKLVVDIGANDGLLSSNSYNFIQWGWSAILVEPQKEQLDMARRNHQRFVDPYKQNLQKVHYVESVIGRMDGYVDLAVTNDGPSMQSHIITKERGCKKGQLTRKVNSMTVETFARLFNITKKFGILSIDAEGIGDEILHSWMEEGFRPGFVIQETIHNKETILETVNYMEKKGYKALTQRGWNLIFEYRN